MSVPQEEIMRTERRGSKAALSTNVNAVLNQDQSLALRKIENFGWQLAFIRQPVFEQPIAVVVSPDRTRYAVLESDGEVNMNPDIKLRH
jgi:hypothetical protein